MHLFSSKLTYSETFSVQQNHTTLKICVKVIIAIVVQQHSFIVRLLTILSVENYPLFSPLPAVAPSVVCFVYFPKGGGGGGGKRSFLLLLLSLVLLQ